MAAQSAVAIPAPLRVIYGFQDHLTHSGYLSCAGPASFVACAPANQGPWQPTTHEPSPLALAAQAIAQ